MDNIKERLFELGIPTAEAKADGTFETSGMKNSAGVTDDVRTIDVYPYHEGNAGFFTAELDGFKCLILKGVFKDFLRVLAGSFDDVSEKMLARIARTSVEVERGLKGLFVIKLIIWGEDECAVLEAQEADKPIPRADMRLKKPARPLSSVEYSINRNEVLSEKILYLAAPFAENFPHTMSPLMQDMAKEVDNILNPLFMSAGFKTLVPSVRILLGRIYVNSKNIETVSHALNANTDFFFLNFAPRIFNKLKKPKTTEPKLSLIDINPDEIDEALSELEAVTESITQEDLFGEDLMQAEALFFMAYEMIYLKIWQCAARGYSYTRDWGAAMKFFYKTRPDSLLYTGYSAPKFFDIANSKTFKGPDLSMSPVEFKDAYEAAGIKAGVMFPKKKLEKTAQEMHEYLGRKDRLFKAANKFCLHLHSLFLNIGEKLVADNIFDEAGDIFYFEKAEIKKLAAHEYNGNVPFTKSFRKAQYLRCSAQVMPHELYEKDIERIGKLGREVLQKSEAESRIAVHPLYEKEYTGGADSYLSALCVPYGELGSLADKEAVVVEHCSMFSALAEYCALTDKPLFTGARFAPLITNSNRLEIKDGYATIVRE